MEHPIDDTTPAVPPIVPDPDPGPDTEIPPDEGAEPGVGDEYPPDPPMPPED